MNRRRGRNKHGPRNFLVPAMRAHTKPGPHRDKRKEAARRACRGKLRPDVLSTSGLFVDPSGTGGPLSARTSIRKRVQRKRMRGAHGVCLLQLTRGGGNPCAGSGRSQARERTQRLSNKKGGIVPALHQVISLSRLIAQTA